VISSAPIYLFLLAFIATAFSMLEKREFKIFKFIPAVVFIYAFSMILATIGMFEYNQEINSIYKLTKTNLLPAMLFLMLLQIDFRHFFKLGKSLMISYLLALFSLFFGFVVVATIFNFDKDTASAFGALAGSWMGGTANMIAVGSALGTSQEAFGYALIVDSVNYTLWVMLLLFLVPFANIFNRFTKSDECMSYLGEVGCSCNIGAKRYWLLVSISIVASLISQLISQNIEFLNKTTTIVLVASSLGVIGSFTKLKELNGSSEISTTMLYIIISLIGSKAIFDSFGDIGIYIFAGFVILIIHAVIMVIGAKIFKLDLFSIAVSSLANIGGVASAPILAAAYNKSLVSVGVLMAIMGYLIGTFGGLLVGNIIIAIS
jgi:uncharacterized membrane protein